MADLSVGFSLLSVLSALHLKGTHKAESCAVRAAQRGTPSSSVA